MPGLKDFVGFKVRINPQKRGTCLKVLTQTPRKPNSATRKIAKVRLRNFKRITIFIGGIGHNLRVYSNVLVRGGGARDLPSSKYQAIRGKYDFQALSNLERANARSKYGTRRLFKIISTST